MRGFLSGLSMVGRVLLVAEAFALLALGVLCVLLFLSMGALLGVG